MGINVFEDTFEDIRNYVIDDRKRGWTYKKIAQERHLSFSTISKILKAEFGSVEDELEKESLQLDETKALKMYEENYEPIQVAIQLNIPTEEAVLFYQKYQQLKCLPLNDSIMRLKSEVQQLEIAKQNSNSQLSNLRNQVAEQARALQYHNRECEEKKNEIFVLTHEANKLRTFIANIQYGLVPY